MVLIYISGKFPDMVPSRMSWFTKDDYHFHFFHFLKHKAGNQTNDDKSCKKHMRLSFVHFAFHAATVFLFCRMDEVYTGADVRRILQDSMQYRNYITSYVIHRFQRQLWRETVIIQV